MRRRRNRHAQRDLRPEPRKRSRGIVLFEAVHVARAHATRSAHNVRRHGLAAGTGKNGRGQRGVDPRTDGTVQLFHWFVGGPDNPRELRVGGDAVALGVIGWWNAPAWIEMTTRPHLYVLDRRSAAPSLIEVPYPFPDGIRPEISKRTISTTSSSSTKIAPATYSWRSSYPTDCPRTSRPTHCASLIPRATEAPRLTRDFTTRARGSVESERSWSSSISREASSPSRSHTTVSRTSLHRTRCP